MEKYIKSQQSIEVKKHFNKNQSDKDISSKVLSLRVDSETAEIVDKNCKEAGVSKNKYLSELVTDNNFKIKKGQRVRVRNSENSDYLDRVFAFYDPKRKLYVCEPSLEGSTLYYGYEECLFD